MSNEINTRIGVDIGGTFTDVVLSVDEELIAAKVPTTKDQSLGAIRGIKKACKKAGIEPDRISEFIHSMTVPVNAILERKGAKTSLITTEGFKDIIEIRRQDRTSLYDLNQEKPDPLIPRKNRFEVDERSTHEKIEKCINEKEIKKIAKEIEQKNIQSVAVSLLHSYSNPENEEKIKKILKKENDLPISLSSEILAEFREYERTSTTIIDAYVTPKINGYLSRLSNNSEKIGVPDPKILQSNGGITSIENVQGVKTVIPAAGAVGAPVISNNAISMDMGGTSCDISLIRDGEIEKTTEMEIGGHPIRTQTLNIKTVGSGGGSIAWVDEGNALRVGPESAGSDPGPVCYGKGGEKPTVTDANLILGYIGEDSKLGGELSIDKKAAEKAMKKVSKKAEIENTVETSQGIYKIANANISQGIRSLTVKRGKDPREFEIIAIGGAGPLHAATLAEELGIEKVKIPYKTGVFSAFGLLAADEKKDSIQTHKISLKNADKKRINNIYESLKKEVLSKVSNKKKASVRRSADLRYIGQSFELTVPADKPLDIKKLEKKFHEIHESERGYKMDEKIEIVNLRTTAVLDRKEPERAYKPEGEEFKKYRDVFFGEWYETPVYRRERLPPGKINGPAVFEEEESTTLVPPNWTAKINDKGTISLLKK